MKIERESGLHKERVQNLNSAKGSEFEYANRIEQRRDWSVGFRQSQGCYNFTVTFI